MVTIAACAIGALMPVQEAPPLRARTLAKIGGWSVAVHDDRAVLEFVKGSTTVRLRGPEMPAGEEFGGDFTWWGDLVPGGTRLIATFARVGDSMSSPSTAGGVAEIELGATPRIGAFSWLPEVDGRRGAGLGGTPIVLGFSEARVAVLLVRDVLAADDTSRVFVLRRPGLSLTRIWTLYDEETDSSGRLSGWSAAKGAPGRLRLVFDRTSVTMKPARP